MNESTADTLMESIAANRLSILCGAGLSMASPSDIPSANAVAEICRTGYRFLVGRSIPEPYGQDLEQMALWFRQQQTFDSLFIERLVPWAHFNKPPNLGHEAIADFLACGVAREATTTNFDNLIERAAERLGEPDFRAIVEVADLPAARLHNALLKVHGCGVRGRLTTVWCKEQLDEPPLRDRSGRFRTWLATQLLGRDILIVGFWSDWLYLMEVFASSLPALGQCKVVVVNPDSSADLERKAPALWAWAHGPNVTFIHEQESGAEFLDELRSHWGRVFLAELLERATSTHEDYFGAPASAVAHTLNGLTSEDLYALRRDLTGTPCHRVARDKAHQPRFDLHSAFHRRLLDDGATYEYHTYRIGGQIIRLISGHGELLSAVRARFADEPALPVPQYRVVCVGATPDSAAVNVVRPDEAPTILGAGMTTEWSTHDELAAQLRLRMQND